jgi:uncharacterized protein
MSFLMPVSPETITFGVIADTHIPDRARRLPDRLLEILQAAHINAILHAGDASSWKVIHELETIAPVTIVQGNRDWLMGMQTPRHKTLVANNIRITLAHGHRSMLHYLVDKWSYIKHGYIFERYYQLLSQDHPNADVIVFGHTHHQTAKWIKGQLFFNPGAAYPCKYNNFNPQYGILSITPDGKIRTECHNWHTTE